MGCGCLIALLGLSAPRFALLVTWLFTDRMRIAFDSFLVAFLGFLVLPFTTLFYALSYAPVRGVHGFGWILVGFGVVLDLSASGGGVFGRRRRVERW
jgi:hypothetical protein